MARPCRERGEVESETQRLPTTFAGAFPGGWSELLTREGITLPTGK